MKYKVVATRTTYYEVEAESEEEAIDLMIDEEATEVHGETERLSAQPAVEEESS